MNCKGCGTQMDWPSEVLAGIAIGVCSQCGHTYGQKPPYKPDIDMRGAPARPGRTT